MLHPACVAPCYRDGYLARPRTGARAPEKTSLHSEKAGNGTCTARTCGNQGKQREVPLTSKERFWWLTFPTVHSPPTKMNRTKRTKKQKPANNSDSRVPLVRDILRDIPAGHFHLAGALVFPGTTHRISPRSSPCPFQLHSNWWLGLAVWWLRGSFPFILYQNKRSKLPNHQSKTTHSWFPNNWWFGLVVQLVVEPTNPTALHTRFGTQPEICDAKVVDSHPQVVCISRSRGSCYRFRKRIKRMVVRVSNACKREPTNIPVPLSKKPNPRYHRSGPKTKFSTNPIYVEGQGGQSSNFIVEQVGGCSR